MDNRFLFRGKDCNGNWIIGSLIQQAFDGINRHEVGIAPYGCYPIGIDITTVGQCTGLSAVKSYRGNKPEDLLIWEGDEVLVSGTKRVGVYKTSVIFVKESAMFKLKENKTYFVDHRSLLKVREIISTIHE